MTRRLLSTICLVVCALISWPATPHGQRFPTLSGDLALHPAGHRGHRVIVQGDANALLRLRGRHPRGFRELPAGGAVIDVTDAELDDLQHDTSLLHISGDLPVARRHGDHEQGDRRPRRVWQGTQGPARPVRDARLHGQRRRRRHPRLRHRAAHRARLARRRAREPRVERAAATGDPFGHGTHVAGIIGGNTTAAKSVTPAYAGGSAPAVSLIDVRVLGSDGVGLTSDVIAGIDWAIANRKQLQHPRHQPVARPPGDRAVDHRPAVPGGRARGRAPASSSSRPPATTADQRAARRCSAASPRRATRRSRSRSARSTRSGTVDRVRRHASRRTARAGRPRYEIAVKPDVVAPGTKLVSLEAQGSYLDRALSRSGTSPAPARTPTCG